MSDKSCIRQPNLLFLTDLEESCLAVEKCQINWQNRDTSPTKSSPVKSILPYTTRAELVQAQVLIPADLHVLILCHSAPTQDICTSGIGISQ